MCKNKPNTDYTRKEAIVKMGKFAALTAVGTFFILNPQKSQAQSIPPPTTNGGDPFLDYND